MRATWCRTLALLLILGGSVRAADSWADRLFTEPGVDFGAVPRGAILRHNFELINRTGEIVNILDVRASCGCTTGRASATTVAPGQSAVIEAQMDTRNFVGVKATTLMITLVSASGRQAEARLSVRSNILSDIVLNPGAVHFGLVSRGQAAEQHLTIDRHAAPGWKIERMLASKTLGRSIDANLSETHRGPRGVGYQLTVRVRPDAPAGVFHEEIRLVTNDRETPIVPVLVSGEVRGALSASPALLTLGPATTAAGAVEGRVLVRGSAPFAITAVEGAGDGFVVSPTGDDRKPLHVLTISFHPEQTALRGDLKRSVRVTTDMPGEPPLEIQVSVQAAP